MTRLPTTVSDPLPVHVQSAPLLESSMAPTPGEIASMLRRRALMIFMLFVVFCGMTVGGFVLMWHYFPGYEAECLIECISNIPETELSLEMQRLREDEHDRFVQTQAVSLKSPRILGEALKNNAVRQTDWFKKVMDQHEEPMLRLDEDLRAGPVRGTNFLRVSIETRDSDDPAVIVNEVVNRWYDDVKKRTADEFATGGLQQAAKDREALDRQIADKRERIKAIAQQVPIGALRSPGVSLVAAQVLQYGQQVTQHEMELSQLAQYRDIYNNPDGGPVTAEDRAIVEQDPQVQQLVQAIFLLEQRRASDSEVFGAEHKEVRQLDAQIRAANDKLDQLRLEKLRERKADIREAANTAFANTQHALWVAQENLARAEAEQRDQDRQMFDYWELTEELTRDMEYRDELNKYIRGLEKVRDQRTAIRVNIAQPAIDPLQRSSPSVLLLPLGAFLSLGLALAIGLSVELFDKSVRTSQDIVRHLDVAVLGTIPHADDEEVSIDRIETAVKDAPRSLIAEAFRRIRTALQFSAPLERQRSIAITSPQPEDGATTVACNLALAAAQGGRRVLLIDANLRRPSLRNVFPDLPREGLSNILIGEARLSACAAKTDHPLLHVLGSGPVPPNPVDLIGGPHWRTLLQEAGEKYDQIIIDTPPVLLASDAIVLSTTVDGVILVVRAKRDSRGVARRAWALLNAVNAHLFGAVLNAAQVTRGGYYRQQLRAYYDYQHEIEGNGRDDAKA